MLPGFSRMINTADTALGQHTSLLFAPRLQLKYCQLLWLLGENVRPHLSCGAGAPYFYMYLQESPADSSRLLYLMKVEDSEPQDARTWLPE